MRATILALALLAGCASATDRQRFGDVEWRAVNINGIAVVEANAPTIRFAGDRASGRAGCNNFSAPFERASRERLQFGPVVSTRMACPDPVMEQERRFLSILEAVEGYSFYSDGSLSLVAGDGRAIRFRRSS